MSKLDYDILVLEKLNKVITEQLPKFASGYFKAKKNQMALKSLYGYSLDISGFFKYMEATNDISPKDFTLKDLDKISESDIENFMKSIENVEAYGEVRKRSVQALRRSFFALNSFFTFFYKEDLISTLPTFKVAPPAPVNKPSAMTTASDSLKLLDFVANGTLTKGKQAKYQDYFRERDTAIIALMMLSGLKISEITGLDLIDLRLGKKQLIIRTRKHQTLILSDIVVSIITRYLNQRLVVITRYHHEDALFLSLRYQRIGNRTIEYMFKKYVNACFGDDCNIVPNNLAVSFRDVVFNQSNNIEATSLLTGCVPEYLIKTYKADLDERKNNANLYFTKQL